MMNWFTNMEGCLDMVKSSDTAYMKRFLFERSFDQFGNDQAAFLADSAKSQNSESEENLPGISEEEPEITFTESEMEAAKESAYKDGYDEGFHKGHADAMDQIEKKGLDILEDIGPQIARLNVAQQKAHEHAQINMIRIMQSVTAKLMPVYEKTHGSEEAITVIKDCISDLREAGKLNIFLSAEMADLLKERITEAASRAGFDGEVKIIIDEDMGPSDARLDWGTGGASRDFASIKEQIDAIIERAISKIAASKIAASKITAKSDVPETFNEQEKIPLEDPDLDRIIAEEI
jgi:flagellar biosynthesis/type III secretory pathway protein FliH